MRYRAYYDHRLRNEIGKAKLVQKIAFSTDAARENRLIINKSFGCALIELYRQLICFELLHRNSFRGAPFAARLALPNLAAGSGKRSPRVIHIFLRAEKILLD